MKKLFLILLLLISLFGCKDSFNDETNNTLEDLHLFDNIESISINVFGSSMPGLILTFNNEEALNYFIDSIKDINNATYYDENNIDNSCVDENGDEIYGAPCKEVTDTHDWLDIAPVVRINYTNNKSIKITTHKLTNANNNGGLTISGGTNGNNELIKKQDYINDNFIIAKTVANLIKDQLVYVDTIRKDLGTYSITTFLQVVEYKTNDYTITNTNIDTSTNKELEYYWVDYFNNNFNIYENDVLLDSLPIQGEHVITLKDKNDNTYLVGYNLISYYYLDNYEIVIHN